MADNVDETVVTEPKYPYTDPKVGDLWAQISFRTGDLVIGRFVEPAIGADYAVEAHTMLLPAEALRLLDLLRDNEARLRILYSTQKGEPQ